MGESFAVRFLPEDRVWRGEGPVPLSLVAAACDILIEQPCGSRATCGHCRVRVVDGDVAPDAVDEAALGAGAVAAGWRLGCRLTLERGVTIRVPASTRVVAHKAFGGDRLIDPGVEPIAVGHGIALDLGSTTIAAAVVALEGGAVQGSASVLNPQVRYGGDIMSRIAFAHRRATGSGELHRALLSGVEPVIGEALESAGVEPAGIAEVAVVGNPTMMHAFRALPVQPLGRVPFHGVAYGSWRGDAAHVGLALPAAAAYLLPGVRAHVGADAVAGALAMGLDRSAGPRLLIDLGTNTEIVLAGPGGILCASAASGPAFEGAAIRYGMRAIPGAIDQVRIDGEGRVRVHTIGDVDPVGLCGSGVVDAVAELLLSDVVEPSGRMRTAAEVGDRRPHLARRVVEGEVGRAVRLTDGERPVLLTAADVRELQLVKGSIGAATRVLFQEAGIGVADLEEVMLAGAFGTYVRGASARALGLIPAVDPDRIRFVGNAAGAGARLALVDRRARDRAEALARLARHVELAGRPEYQEAFIDRLRFPDPRAGP